MSTRTDPATLAPVLGSLWSAADARLLEIGTRRAQDDCHYSDVGMIARAAESPRSLRTAMGRPTRISGGADPPARFCASFAGRNVT